MKQIIFLLPLLFCPLLAATESSLPDWAVYVYIAGDDKEQDSLEAALVEDLLEMYAGLQKSSLDFPVVIQMDRGSQRLNTINNAPEDYEACMANPVEFFQPPVEEGAEEMPANESEEAYTPTTQDCQQILDAAQQAMTISTAAFSNAEHEGAERLLFQKNRKQTLAVLEETDSGDAQTFEEFLQFAWQNYPAKKVILVFGGHGTGILSMNQIPPPQKPVVQVENVALSYDDSGNSLSISDLDAIFSRWEPATSGKLALTIMDSCLMAGIEVLHALSAHTKILLGSATTIPGSGMEYAQILEAVSSEATARQLGEIAVQSFQAAHQDSEETELQLAAWDMERYNSIKGEILPFFQLLSETPNAIPSLAPSKEQGNRFFDPNYQDLGAILLGMYRNEALEPALKDAAATALGALDSVFVSRMRSGRYQEEQAGYISGLSILNPQSQEEWQRFRSFYLEQTFARDSAWDEVLDILLPAPEPEAILNDGVFRPGIDGPDFSDISGEMIDL